MHVRSTKGQAGFSLVELMVVVAIIGILASIAIPSIGRYMAKARQSEAKTNLSSLYTAEKAFYAEYNSYTGIFEIVGYNPEGQLRYNVGFANPGVTHATLQASYGYNSPAPPASTTNSIAYCASAANNNQCTTLADAQALAAPTDPTNATFVAEAAGLIRRNSAGATDRWTIDQNKLLSNTADGTQ